MNICYLIPSNFICGGNRIVAEHCKGLAKKGHQVFIAVKSWGDVTWLKKVSGHKVPIIKWHELSQDDTTRNQLDVLVATYFETYYEIKKIEHMLPKTCQKYYFVQQIESRFFDDEANQARANNTYTDKSFKIITEAEWIVSDLKRRFNRDAEYVPNKQELPRSTKLPQDESNKPIVLVEGNAAYKKGVGDAWIAIRDLDCEKWLLTNSKSHELSNEWEFDKIFSSVEWEIALGVIERADVLLKPSHLEGSPTPHMEAMALGTPLVSTDCTGVYEYCINEYNSLIVPVSDAWKMKDAIQRILKDSKLKKKLIANGLKTAEQFNSWQPAIDKLNEIFELDQQFKVIEEPGTITEGNFEHTMGNNIKRDEHEQEKPTEESKKR